MTTLHIGTMELSAFPTARDVLDHPKPLDLPTDIITESTAVIAKKGAGKTNLGVVLVEETHAAGVPVVVLDPKGDWYGIRAGADGDPKGGLPIPVFGGHHGDIPLEPTAGAYIADLVRGERLSVVLDVSEFASDADRRRFLVAFADRLYRHSSREPMMLMLEEAHEYIPQGVSGEDAKMVSVFARIVKQGRYKGLGVVMMTQRSASLNKNVLTQVDNLVMMQTTSPQDRAAVEAWIAGHGEAKAIIAQLPSLAPGEFWLWQPQRGEPVHARARMRSTYDAGATPKVGEKPRPVATLADVDLGAISAAMSETIERAKADDPKALRARIAELERKVQTADNMILAHECEPSEPEIVTVTMSVLTDDDRRFLSEQTTLLHQGVLDLMRTAIADVDRAADKIVAAAKGADKPPLPAARSRVEERRPRQQPAPVQIPPRRLEPGERPTAPADDREYADRPLSPTERGILTVLAQFPKPLSTKMITARGGPSWKSSSFKAALPALRRDGLLAPGGNGELEITDVGRAVIGPVETPPTGRALLEWWRPRLKPTEYGVLTTLVNAYPGSMTAAEVAETSGYSAGSSSFKAAIPALRNQELIYGTNDALHADDVFAD